MKHYYKGKKVLITGAASGLGKGLARQIGSQGGQLILLDINIQALKNTLDELHLLGISAYGYSCDLSDFEQIKQISSQILHEHEAMDILIHSAGIVTGKPFGEYSMEEAELSFRVNVLGPMALSKEFFPVMKERNQGHIVNIASAAGLIGCAHLSDYCGTKFALFGFNEALRVELKRRRLKIRTTVVCPFFINTGMFEGVKTRIPFLLPILKEEKVVKRISNAVKRRQKQLFMPPIVYTIALLRALSAGVLDSLSTLLGVNHCMDRFIGRKSLKKETVK